MGVVEYLAVLGADDARQVFLVLVEQDPQVHHQVRPLREKTVDPLITLPISEIMAVFPV